MSSLTNKLIFFLVFSTLSNFATSDEFLNCEANVKEIFSANNNLQIQFNIAMTAIKQNLITMGFIFDKADKLYGYFKSFNDAIKNIGDETFSLKHDEVLDYFKHHTSVKEFEKKNKYTKKNKNTFATKQEDIKGYHKSFVDTFDNIDYPYIRDWVNDITKSPQDFCEHREAYGLAGVDIDTCNNALCTMLNLRDDDESTAMEKFMNMTGIKAFKYCYLNYTYLDFTTNNSSKQAASSSGILQSTTNLVELSVMIKYFSHLLDVSTRIGANYQEFDVWISALNRAFKGSPIRTRRSLFLTVTDYCRDAVKSGSRDFLRSFEIENE